MSCCFYFYLLYFSDFVDIKRIKRRHRVWFPEANKMSFGGSEQGTALRFTSLPRGCRLETKAPLCKGGSRRSRVGDCFVACCCFTIPQSTSLTAPFTQGSLTQGENRQEFVAVNSPTNQNLSLSIIPPKRKGRSTNVTDFDLLDLQLFKHCAGFEAGFTLLVCRADVESSIFVYRTTRHGKRCSERGFLQI